MALLRHLSSAVTGLVSSFSFASQPSNQVQEINPNQLSKLTVVSRDDAVILYRDGNVFIIILYSPTDCSKAFSLARESVETTAVMTFSNVGEKIRPLLIGSGRLWERGMLQQFMDALRCSPTWSCAHLAAKLGLTELFQLDLVLKHVNSVDEATRMTPIQVAIATESLECVQELVLCGASLDTADHVGENVFHYGARVPSPAIIQLLGCKNAGAINQLNVRGESALHAACLASQPDNLEHLLRWGANPLLSQSHRFPIHCAVEQDDMACLTKLLSWSREQLHVADPKTGGTPLHWATSAECVYALFDFHANLEARNFAGETPLHSVVRRQHHGAMMALLCRTADATALDADGNNALHTAVIAGDTEAVQVLIVFGADVNVINTAGHSARHLAATSQRATMPLMLYLLHKVGAERCAAGLAGCADGCSPLRAYDGEGVGIVAQTPEHQKKFLDSLISEVSMAAALTRSSSASGSSLMTGDSVDGAIGSAGERVLCLDGGGIRGLILIQLLLAIEKVVGRPARSCFDWIAGTSTGGILALGIVHGKSTRYCQGLYFRMKNTVFEGRRPYQSEALEDFMKKEFGENTRMSEVEFPRLLVAGVLADRSPAELHMFRNYDPPGVDYGKLSAESGFAPLPRPNEQRVWQAARASGAAPTYFRAFGRFLDGGLIANNPTLDVLTEIHEHNLALRATGYAEMVKPIHVVVSLGTGRQPQKAVSTCDVFRPGGIMDIWNVTIGARNLGEILVDQATQSEGRPVDRARAWCSMIGVPFYRLSPQLSADVALDCTDDKQLISMLWQTEAYIQQNWGRLQHLGLLLTA